MVHPFPVCQPNPTRSAPFHINPALLFLVCSQGRPEFSEVVTKLEECLCNIEVRTQQGRCVCQQMGVQVGTVAAAEDRVALELLEKSRDEWDTSYEREMRKDL